VPVQETTAQESQHDSLSKWEITRGRVSYLGDDWDDLPRHLQIIPLPELLDHLTPGETFWGSHALFDVPGYDRSELFMEIYVRTAKGYENYFPLPRIELKGAVIDRLIERNGFNTDFKSPQKPQELRGTIYGTGAFRALIAYLEQELPQRGYKGVWLEQVGNEKLETIALRYGFERQPEPISKCFIKRFSA